MPQPAQEKDKPLKALIFDSYYDSYKGVVSYIRVFEGSIKKGMDIRMMSSGKTFEVTEVGYTAGGQRESESIDADVGQWWRPLKRRRCPRNTITDNDHPTDKALPGYAVVPGLLRIYPAEAKSSPLYARWKSCRPRRFHRIRTGKPQAGTGFRQVFLVFAYGSYRSG